MPDREKPSSRLIVWKRGKCEGGELCHLLLIMGNLLPIFMAIKKDFVGFKNH